MNWVLDSIRKSLKTLCRRQSVALVSRISPSTCFLISWVLEIVCCENSCRNCSSYFKKINIQQYQYYMHLFFVSKQKMTRFLSPLCVCMCWNVQGMPLLSMLRPCSPEKWRKLIKTVTRSQWTLAVLSRFWRNFKVLFGCHSTRITKGKTTNPFLKNPIHMRLWNHSTELLVPPA